MVPVTCFAFRQPLLIERDFVGTGREERRVERVTCSAHLRNRFDSRWHRTVIPMTVVARRRADIPFFEQGDAVNTVGKLFQLIGRQLVLFHVFFVGMAPGAGCGNIDGVHPGFNIRRVEDVVASMAAGALSRFFVSHCVALSMNAGPIFFQLIHRNGGIV